jgi:hypothetical protein
MSRERSSRKVNYEGLHPPQIVTEKAQSFGRICAPCERSGAGQMEAISCPDFRFGGRTQSRRHWPDTGSHSRQRLLA